ncbi:MAG: class I SAM-dependent methyltransferase [Heteroscytonema crispum UTEX LB 1556]
MSQQLDLNEYKQQIADLYNRRSHHYDESEWHTRITHRLVEYAQINPGYHVLDIATGTGHVAIEVAAIVGSSGRVVGVDISTGMLEQARQKVEALNISNIEFHLADAETLNFPANSFDRILCAHAFPWMADKEAALRLWYSFLKPGGLIGIHTPTYTTYIADFVLQEVLEKNGVTIIASSKPTGTVEKCQNILEKTGFEAIEIKTEEYEGNYINLEQAKQKCNASYYPALSQFSSEQLEQIKAEFDVQLEALATEKGIWNDGIALFAFGRKPV